MWAKYSQRGLSEPKLGEWGEYLLEKEGVRPSVEIGDWLQAGVVTQIKTHTKVSASQISYCQRRKL